MGIIYCHRNLVNGKCYIGQTSKDLTTRVGGSPSRAYSNNKDFALDIKEYGWQNFESRVLEEVDNDHLTERETYWIDRIRQDGTILYNRYLKGTSNFHKTVLVNNKTTGEDKTNIERLFKEGKSLREIGELVGVSPQTVKSILIDLGYSVPGVGNLCSFDREQKRIVLNFIGSLKCSICGENFKEGHEIRNMLCSVGCRGKYLKLAPLQRQEIKTSHLRNVAEYKLLRKKLKEDRVNYKNERQKIQLEVKEARKALVSHKIETLRKENSPKHTAEELYWRKDELRCKQKLDLILNSGVDLMKFGYNAKLCRMFPELDKRTILFLLRKYNIPHFERAGSISTNLNL